MFPLGGGRTPRSRTARSTLVFRRAPLPPATPRGAPSRAGTRSRSGFRASLRFPGAAGRRPGRSALFTTKRSAISMMPDLRVWMPSPDSGTRTSTVESTLRATSSSDCPTPTVSMMIRSKPAGVEHVADFAGRGGEPAQRAAGGHRADEDPGIERQRLHPDPVAQQGTAGERAGRVHRHDRHGESVGPESRRQPLGQGGLAGAGRTGDPDAPWPGPGEG